MGLMAENPSDRARQILALTTRLGERLVRETEILRSHRPQDLLEGIEETRTLSNLYRHESMRIKADPSLLAGISAVEKTALRDATVLFNERLHLYELAVSAAKTVTEGIISAVAEDLNTQRNQATTYGAGGRTRDTGPQSLNYGKRA